MAAKLEQYRVFKEVADTGNISGTAKRLYLSQSAVSQSVKLLEQELGVRLFSRTARGVTLTSEGRLLYDYASRALALLEAGEERLLETQALRSGELTIGANDTITKYYLLPFLQAYHKRYPNVRVRISNGTSQRVLELLQNGRSCGFCDFVFCRRFLRHRFKRCLIVDIQSDIQLRKPCGFHTQLVLLRERLSKLLLCGLHL